MTALHERFGQIGNDMFRAAIAQRRNALVQRRNLRDAKRPHVVLLPGLEQHSSVAVDERSRLSATSSVPRRLPASHPATVRPPATPFYSAASAGFQYSRQLWT